MFKEIFEISNNQNLAAHGVTEKAYKESGLQEFTFGLINACFHDLQSKDEKGNKIAGSYENLAQCAKAVKDICGRIDEYVKVK